MDLICHLGKKNKKTPTSYISSPVPIIFYMVYCLGTQKGYARESIRSSILTRSVPSYMVSTIKATGKFSPKLKSITNMHIMAGEEVMKSVVDSSHAHPAATSRSQRGNLGPAAEACQQAVMEAECEPVTHSAHT